MASYLSKSQGMNKWLIILIVFIVLAGTTFTVVIVSNKPQNKYSCRVSSIGEMPECKVDPIGYFNTLEDCNRICKMGKEGPMKNM